VKPLLWSLLSLVVITACRKPEAPPPPAPAPVKPVAPVVVSAVDAGHGVGAVTPTLSFADGDRVALRRFTRDGAPYLLLVHPQDLSVSTAPEASLHLTPCAWDEVRTRYAGTPWVRALTDVAQHAASLQDAGLTHLLPTEKGVVLTVDLCPTRKHFARALVEGVLQSFEPAEKPVPIAFAITGAWMAGHADDLKTLQDLVARHELDITWVNHSFHHRFDPAKALTQNFLLEPGTDVDQEVLLQERAMLEAGLTPSVFFRFPGLISDEALVRRVIGLGLIPVGSDAWLAKREPAKDGSIVLVHGNGNEPQGVADFLELIHKEKAAIAKHQFLLLDLRTGVDDEEAAPPTKP
jgi:hypothetical protein